MKESTFAEITRLNLNVRECLNRLRMKIGDIAFERVWPYIKPVVADCRFTEWPASVPGRDGKAKHHGDCGGLLRHTEQVFDHVWQAQFVLPDHGFTEDALVVGVFWHDMGKMDEYCRDGKGGFMRDPSAYQLSHICRGLMHWSAKFPESINTSFHMEVAHYIASHHGRKEWGSPVTPQTPAAWALHYADVQSVMIEGNQNPADR